MQRRVKGWRWRVAAGGTVAIVLAGCASGEREAYFASRGRVVHVEPGDGSRSAGTPSAKDVASASSRVPELSR